SETSVTVKPHPGPSFRRESFAEPTSLKRGPDDLLSRPQRLEARQLAAEVPRGPGRTTPSSRRPSVGAGLRPRRSAGSDRPKPLARASRIAGMASPWLDIELRHLDTFRVLAEELSFRATAKRVGFAPSAVSAHIS